MRAVFLVESGSNFGFGHCSRSYALAEELLHRGWTIDFFVIGDKFCKEPSINVSIHLIEDINGFQDNNHYNLRVVDCYQVTIHKLSMFTNKKTWFIIDDKEHAPSGSNVLYPSAYALTEGPLHQYDKVVGGLNYLLLDRRLRSMRKCENGSKKGVTIALGSFPDIVILRKAIKFVQREFHDQEINIVGDVVVSTLPIYEKANFLGLITKQELYATFLGSRLVITNTGVTLNEALALGCPTMGIIAHESQRRNGHFWQKRGANIYSEEDLLDTKPPINQKKMEIPLFGAMNALNEILQ